MFRVSKVIRGDPNVYEIEDHEGEPIIRKFYEQELSGVEVPLTPKCFFNNLNLGNVWSISLQKFFNLLSFRYVMAY